MRSMTMEEYKVNKDDIKEKRNQRRGKEDGEQPI